MKRTTARTIPQLHYAPANGCNPECRTRRILRFDNFICGFCVVFSSPSSTRISFLYRSQKEGKEIFVEKKIKSVFQRLIRYIYIIILYIYIHFFYLYTYGACLVTLHSFSSQRVLFMARTKISYTEITRGMIYNFRIFDKDEFCLVYVFICRDTEAKFSSGSLLKRNRVFLFASFDNAGSTRFR